jgi:DNA-binding transcriptional regulator YdaS (Cro superfamily)
MHIGSALDGLERALKAAGGTYSLTRALGYASPSVVGNWRRAGGIPAARVPDVARVTGLPPDVLRPDLFANAPKMHTGMAETQPPFATFGQYNLLTVSAEVKERFATIQVGDDGPHGHSQYDVRRTGSVPIRALTLLSIFGPMKPCVSKVDQRVDVAIGQRIDGPAATTVSATRAAFWNELLTTKGRHTVAALAGVYLNNGLVDEFHGCRTKQKPRWGAGLMTLPQRTTAR